MFCGISRPFKSVFREPRAAALDGTARRGPNTWDRVWATGTEAAELGETPPRFLAETMNPPEVPGPSLRHACVRFPHA